MCVWVGGCVCGCVRERERERERGVFLCVHVLLHVYASTRCVLGDADVCVCCTV